MIKALKSLIQKNSVDPVWLDIAEAERANGVQEFKQGSNPRIIEYHASTSLKSTDDNVAWCSAFVNWVMMKSGYLITHSAAARSWLGYGKRLSKFKKGCIVVLKRGREPWQGHVGFGIMESTTHVTLLGGNQSNSVCYQEYPKADILAYVWPREEDKV